VLLWTDNNNNRLGACRESRDTIPFCPERYSDNPHELFSLAISLEDAGHDERALDAYRRCIALGGPRAEAFFDMGQIHRRGGDRSAALEMYRFAIAVNPRHTLALYNAACLEMDAARYESALDLLDDALRVDPAFADAVYNSAICLERLERVDEALSCWSKYDEMDLDGPKSEIAAARVKELTSPGQAV
jgi:tetratricopeptide (TPR) repeat protein